MVRGILSLRGAAAAVIDAAADKRFALITSYRLIEELADMLSRPRISKYHIDPQRLAAVLEVLEFSEVVPGVPRERFVEADPDDDCVLAAAFEGKADAIVTEDRELLNLKSVGGVELVTASQFLESLRSG